ncbi:MAG TPA: nucleoside hydrolase [Candidatus Saccharimonadales bacterium]|nr:nucleoside hydrolase [Candidatus Saccharimonadales bacterium]
MPTKILLDTDIGTDIDDSVCLAYLLAQPECELLGITTATGESEKRAKMASVLCKIAKKDIPIFPGVENPLLIKQRQTHAKQAIRLKNWNHQKNFQKGKAIEFLKETIHKHPGEITLLTIAPLTNIALLFSTYPEIPSMLKEIVMMGGLFKSRLPQAVTWDLTEWNIIIDPHAAAIVFNAPVKIRAVGLDVTTQVFMNSQEVKKRFQGPLLEPVKDFAGIWFEEKETMLFHDPLAATTIFNKDICQFEQTTIEVELMSEKLLGTTVLNKEGKDKKHWIATSVNKDSFFEHYFSIFNNKK